MIVSHGNQVLENKTTEMEIISHHASGKNLFCSFFPGNEKKLVYP